MTLSRQQRVAILKRAFEEVYEGYPEEWARTFEQGPFRPPWYKRLWRWVFPPPAVLSGFAYCDCCQGRDPCTCGKT